MIEQNEKHMFKNKKYWNTELSENNNNDSEFPKNKTALDLFHHQVENTPNEIAVVFKENILTYKELDALSNQLAHYLINEQNVALGDFVAIIQHRTEMLIVSILGILKSGAAYVLTNSKQSLTFVLWHYNSLWYLKKLAISNLRTSFILNRNTSWCLRSLKITNF